MNRSIRHNAVNEQISKGSENEYGFEVRIFELCLTSLVLWYKC